MKDRILTAFKKNPTVRKKLEKIFKKDEFQNLIGEEKRLIEFINGLKPDKPLAEDPLIFDPNKMKEWVDLGEKKAREIIEQSPFVQH